MLEHNWDHLKVKQNLIKWERGTQNSYAQLLSRPSISLRKSLIPYRDLQALAWSGFLSFLCHYFLLQRPAHSTSHSHPGPSTFLLLSLFFFFRIYCLIDFWLRWVFVAACGLSLVAASGGSSSLRCVGFSLQWLLLLRSTGSRRAGFSSCGTRAQ